MRRRRAGVSGTCSMTGATTVSGAFAGSFGVSFGGGGLRSSGISIPPVKPGTLSPSANPLPFSTRHQSGCSTLAPSSDALARCGAEGPSSGSAAGAALVRRVRGSGTTRRSPFGRRSSSWSRCAGTEGVGAWGTPAPVPAAATISSGVPRPLRMRCTAAGVSTVAPARRRSISLRNSDTSRIRVTEGSCRCCATSPTRLRYS